MDKKNRRAGEVIAACAAAALVAGCQCTPPVRSYVETRTEIPIPTACAPARTNLVTVIQHPAEPCAALPPVGEITVVRSTPARTKMVFVYVRPIDDRCFNVESRNFERPWPWGAYGMGDCRY